MLNDALVWFQQNSKRLKSVSLSGLDYYPPDGDGSFSFGFEARKTVDQIIVWDEGYIKFLSLDKNTMTQSVKDIKAGDFLEMEKYLNEFLAEVLLKNDM